MIRRILSALTVAALGAAAGAWLGWRSPVALLTDQEARALVAAAVPDVPAEFVERSDAVFGYPYGAGWFLGGEYLPGFAVVTVNVGADGFEALSGRARDGFERTGWSTTGSPYGDGGFVARRDGLLLTAYGAVACLPEDREACGSQLSGGRFGGLAVQFERDRPAPALPLSVAGWLTGLLAGWFVPARSGALWWTGMSLTLPATAVVTLTTAAPGNDPVWEPYMGELTRPLTLAGGLLLMAALVRAHGDAPAAGGSAGASRSSAQEPKFWV
ncbi:hypothetical protein AB0G04_11825 [Actinoplanes sp. NPDC023801]|uniref:hypothetical protein n=1 Tax=Actinoplanes sp. NPDC023801 TaxID=3154595 RepID=UPI0033F48F99